MKEGRYGKLPSTVLFGVDEGAVLEGITAGMQLKKPARLPLVILADTFNRVFFCSEGYSIGLGERIAALVFRF